MSSKYLKLLAPLFMFCMFLRSYCGALLYLAECQPINFIVIAKKEFD